MAKISEQSLAYDANADGLVHTSVQPSDNLVAFASDDDPENPQNWPTWYKWLCVGILSAVNTIG